jgi:3-methyladenine DNA glycosylase AlkD
MTHTEILKKLEKLGNPADVEGMGRYGIRPRKAYGVRIPVLRKLAGEIGPDHRLAGRLFSSGVHEARILASMIDDPARVTEAQMERWVKAFDSWDVCDQCCLNLFRRTRFARAKVVEWSTRDEEFVKRAAFALAATLAVHDHDAPDGVFKSFLSIVRGQATDERDYVKKAVSWALRQIGKRNLALNRAAVGTAEEIGRIDSKAARWISSDALKELTNEKVQERLRAQHTG